MTDYHKEDPDTIKAMFGSIAKQYDRANAIMSLNMHRHWNRALVRTVTNHSPPKNYLDLCSGTGEIAFTFLKQAKSPCEAFLLDFCSEMLQCAQEKAERNNFSDHHIHFLQADAQEIPLPSESVDCVTMAYGIRNVKDPTKSAQEVIRVLKPGGCFAILELTQPQNPLMKFGHQLYLKAFIPLVGKWVALNPKAYRYLCNSIQNFIPPAKLEQVLKDAGFHKTSTRSLTGGIATILLGIKGEMDLVDRVD